MSFGKRTEQDQVSPVDGEAKADDGKAGKDSDEDREDEEEHFFVRNAFQPGKQWFRKEKSGRSRSFDRS
jgi:hypothetical protein